MTSQELFPKFEEIFILVMETAGQKTGNKIYQSVKNIVDKRRDRIKEMTEEDVPFNIFVAYLEILIILEVHGVEHVEELNSDECKELLDNMFNLYIKKPLRKFTSTNGLPSINSLDLYFSVFTKKI